jgi:hypothetical protein
VPIFDSSGRITALPEIGIGRRDRNSLVRHADITPTKLRVILLSRKGVFRRRPKFPMEYVGLSLFCFDTTSHFGPPVASTLR